MKDEVNQMIADGTIKNVVAGPSQDNWATICIKHPESHRIITYERLVEMARTGYATSDEVQLIAKAIINMSRI